MANKPLKRSHGQGSYKEKWGITQGDFHVIMEAESFADSIKDGINNAIVRALYRIGLECESYAKDLCHVVTGRLRNSITFDIQAGEKSVYVGTNVEYAQFEEEGTSRRPPHPFLRPAAEGHASEWRQIVEDELESGG